MFVLRTRSVQLYLRAGPLLAAIGLQEARPLVLVTLVFELAALTFNLCLLALDLCLLALDLYVLALEVLRAGVRCLGIHAERQA